MGLERVMEEIQTGAKRSAESEVARARAEADALVTEAERQAQTIRAERAEAAKAAVESLRRRELAAAELDVKKLRLNAQKDVLAKLRHAAFERLAAQSVDKRAQHLQALLKRSTVQHGKILVAERDQDAAKKAGIAFAGTVPATGGLVVESPDGSTREDLTVESLFEEVWSQSLPKISETLFAKE